MAEVQTAKSPEGASQANTPGSQHVAEVELSAFLNTLDMPVTIVQPEELKARLAATKPAESDVKQCSVSSIGIVDNFEQKVIAEDPNLRILGSHGELVALSANGSHPLIAYNAPQTDNIQEVDNKLLVQSLQDIRSRAADDCIKTVNISLGRPITLDSLNELMEYAGDDFKEKAGEITAENLAEKAPIIRQAIEQVVSDGPGLFGELTGTADVHKKFKEALDVSNAINDLVKDNISVVVAAGNQGPGTVSLFSVLAPDTITACGTGSNMNTAAKDSAYNSMVDICGPMDRIVADKSGQNTIRVHGTSFVAPDIAEAVATRRDQGVSAAEVNEALAENRAFLMPKPSQADK